jgi:hypothetical protein
MRNKNENRETKQVNIRVKEKPLDASAVSRILTQSVPRDRNLCIKGCRGKPYKKTKAQKQRVRVQEIVLT